MRGILDMLMELMLGQGRLPFTNHYTPEVSHSTWQMEGSFSGPNFWAVRQTNSSSIWAVQEALNCRYQKKTAPRNQCFFCTIIPKHTSSGECRNAVAFLNIFKVWHDLPRKNLGFFEVIFFTDSTMVCQCMPPFRENMFGTSFYWPVNLPPCKVPPWETKP